MTTRLKEKEEDVSFVDYKLLKREVARLGNVKKNVTIEINSESRKLSDLVQKGIEAKAEAEKIISDAKIKADGIIAKAKERESGIVKLESEFKGKIGDANKREKEAGDLIKSNQGKEKNLLAAKETTTEIKAKLTKVVDLIKDVI